MNVLNIILLIHFQMYSKLRISITHLTCELKFWISTNFRCTKCLEQMLCRKTLRSQCWWLFHWQWMQRQSNMYKKQLRRIQIFSLQQVLPRTRWWFYTSIWFTNYHKIVDIFFYWFLLYIVSKNFLKYPGSPLQKPQNQEDSALLRSTVLCI